MLSFLGIDPTRGIFHRHCYETILKRLLPNRAVSSSHGSRFAIDIPCFISFILLSDTIAHRRIPTLFGPSRSTHRVGVNRDLRIGALFVIEIAKLKVLTCLRIGCFRRPLSIFVGNGHPQRREWTSSICPCDPEARAYEVGSTSATS